MVRSRLPVPPPVAASSIQRHAGGPYRCPITADGHNNSDGATNECAFYHGVHSGTLALRPARSPRLPRRPTNGRKVDLGLYTFVMARRSLPERTVDAWVSSAVCTAFPHAGIWGPTQAIEASNWDYGLSLGDGKIFILEDKGTTAVERKRTKPLETHRINIDRNQLRWYCDTVEARRGVPVYYVLPQPPWIGGATGSQMVPDQAICRVDSIAGRFEAWAFVTRCTDLRDKLGGRASIYTHELPFGDGWSLADFLRLVRECQIGVKVSGTGESSKLTARSPEQAGDTSEETIVNRRPTFETYVGSSLAVFIPSEDLPTWGHGAVGNEGNATVP